MKNDTKHLLLLLLAALIWGTAFVAQSVGAEYVGAFTYLAGRSWCAVVVLLPVIRVMDRLADKAGRDNLRPRTPQERTKLRYIGLICGTALFLASAAQQIGMADTTTAKAGFITAQYVVLVPIISIFLGKRPPARIWGCVALGFVGLYLLCMSGGFTLTGGDVVMLACAALFSVQILCVDHFSPQVDGVRLSWCQFFVVAVESTVFMLLLEHPTPDALRAAAFSIAYAGVFSSGIAYTLQIVGQKGVNPALASLAMSLESVFSALSGWIILGQSLTLRELSGCALMFAAIIIAQLPVPARKANTFSAAAK